MPKYGFTERELSTYFKPNKQNISNFGRVFDFNNLDAEFKPLYLGQKDYIKLCIYSVQTNQILQETILRVKDLSPNYDLKYLKLNPDKLQYIGLCTDKPMDAKEFFSYA